MKYIMSSYFTFVILNIKPITHKVSLIIIWINCLSYFEYKIIYSRHVKMLNSIQNNLHTKKLNKCLLTHIKIL